MRASFVHTVFPDELVNLSKRDERFSFVYFHQFGFSAGNVMMNVTGYCCTHLWLSLILFFLLEHAWNWAGWQVGCSLPRFRKYCTLLFPCPSLFFLSLQVHLFFPKGERAWIRPDTQTSQREKRENGRFVRKWRRKKEKKKEKKWPSKQQWLGMQGLNVFSSTLLGRTVRRKWDSMSIYCMTVRLSNSLSDRIFANQLLCIIYFQWKRNPLKKCSRSYSHLNGMSISSSVSFFPSADPAVK